MGLHRGNSRCILDGVVMDFQKLNENAMTNARKALVEKFDPVAFLVYSTARQNLQNGDIDGTEVDNSIRGVFSAFSAYYRKSTSGDDAENELKEMLDQIQKMLTELYFQTGTEGKTMIREICKDILNIE